MELKILGVDFPHKKGEFCHKTKYPYFTVCCFSTPFLYLHNDSLCKGEEGDILINTPDHIVYHGPRENSNDGFVNDWMHIEGEDFAKLLEKYPLPLNTAFNVGESFFLRKYVNRLFSEYNSEKIGSDAMIDCLITQMIIDTHRAFVKANSFDEPYADIAAVKRKIIKNPAKNWSLSKMSEISGYSVSRFSELYNKLYGTSPMNDVINQRILLAKRLLESGQASVSHVAESCGFNTINYFSKYFKKSTGYSPSEYAKSFYKM
ncbi:MAG: helix-turn-helix transcriptional regulator [Clostridia bacterium]|nr:helix-turn-helix transcriptional regulator [Clostridia bacterium]